MNTHREVSKFNSFIQNINDLPLWIKEVLYLDMGEVLFKSVSHDYMNLLDKKNMFQFYTPILTFNGKNELETHEKGYHLNIYKFMECIKKEQSIIEITINNFWTLEEVATFYTDLLHAEMVSPPPTQLLEGTAFYLSGKIRIGEFFTRMGKLTIVQLDEALRQQKQIQESTGDRIGIATVLMNLNYLSTQDIQAILLIKEEAKKRYLIDTKFDSMKTGVQNPEIDAELLTKQIAKLKHDNNILKEQLRKILNISK